MAGPDGRPAARAARRSTSSRPTGSPTATSPTTSPTRCCPENRQFIIDKVVDEGADLGIAWDGDADRCFFIDDTRRVRRRRLPDRDPRRAPAGQEAGRDDPLRRPRLARGARHRRARRAARRTSTASATRSSRRACATRARSSAARSPATTTSTTSTTPTPARSRRCWSSRSSRSRASKLTELLEPLPLAVLHLGRDQLRGRRRRGEDGARSRSATVRRARVSHLDGVSVDYDDWHFNVRPSNTEPLLRLSLESLVSRGGHGAPARRGARRHPLP